MKKAPSKKTHRAPRGRPRAFDTEKALERALQLFWKKGYEGTSLSDLTRAMGVNRPSLYAAFGNKEALFHKVLERYTGGPASYVPEALGKPTARAVAERLLEGAANFLTGTGHPPGCLLVQGALSCGDGAEPIRKGLVSSRSAVEAEIRRRLEHAKSEGDLRRDAKPAELARYLATVVQGMSVRATGGASRAELNGVVQMAMRAWPKAAR